MFYFISILILLTSCTHSPLNEKLVSTYLTQIPENLPGHYEMKSVLNKNISMAGGDYLVSATPFTKAYVHAMASDLTDERHLTTADSKKLLTHLKEKFLTDKVCFQIETSVLKFEKAAKLSDWKLFFVTKNNTEYPLKWIKVNPSIKRNKQRSGDKLISWLSDGTVCSVNKVGFYDSFFLKVKATYSPFPFSTTALLHWPIFKEYRKTKNLLLPAKNQVGKEIKESKKEENEKKYRDSYKSYRGW